MKLLSKKSKQAIILASSSLAITAFTAVSAVACYWTPNTVTNTINITKQPQNITYTASNSELPVFNLSVNWTASSFPAQTEMFYQWYWYTAANSSNINNNAGGAGGGIMFKNGSGSITDIAKNEATISYEITQADLKLFNSNEVWIYCVVYTLQGPNQKPNVANNNGFITSNAVNLIITK